MTVYRWDGSSWIEVDGVSTGRGDAVVRVRRQDGWELVWPSNIDHVAVDSGTWSDARTWDDGVVPGDGSRVLVTAGTTVTVAGETDRIDYARVDGTLRHATDRDSRLRVETLVTKPGSTYEMGTEATPIDPSVTAEVAFIDQGPLDTEQWPDRLGKGLVAEGEVEIVGAEKTGWGELSQHASAGDTAVSLAAAPTNWRAGDTIVIPGLESYSSTSLDHEDERRTISSVSAGTVSFGTPLEHDHVPPREDLPTYVMNLTRNARFVSESDDVDRYGHFMMKRPEQTVKYLETVDVGRTEKSRDPTVPNWDRGTPEPASPPNPRGRYSIHFHHTGPTEPPHRVVGCSVRGSPGWGVVNHDSHAEVEDCVSYDCFGAGFVAESGTEVGHFERNFALRSTGSGEHTESRNGWSNTFANEFTGEVDDFGHSGHGFWIHSPLVGVAGNVAGGHRHTPITFWTRALHEQPLDRDSTGALVEFLDGKHDMFPKLPRELLTDLERTYARTGDEEPAVGDRYHDKDASWVYGTSLPMRSFEDNVAFGCGGGFDLRGGLSFRNQQSTLHRAVHRGNTSYNTGDLHLADGTTLGRENFKSSGNVGLDHRYVGNLEAEGYRLVGDGDGVAVYNNFSYIDDFHVRDSTIDGWDVGVVPSAYTDTSRTTVVDTTFERVDTDIRVRGRLGDDGRLLAEGNSYSGNTTLEWPEIGAPNLIPNRVTNYHSGVTWEGRTVYHGWSDPAFVLVAADDDDRLDTLMNGGGEAAWRELLDGDDPRSVLPGATHQQLYDEYGITFYGGLLDPADGETRSDFEGSGGTYDSTPFLGPAEKTQPTDEIWIDAVDRMSFSGDHEVVEYGDGVDNEEPIRLANDRTVVQLDRDGDRSWGLPVSDTEGVAAYDFSVDTTGTYSVFTRAQQGEDNGGVGSAAQNSRFYVRMDGGPWKKLTRGSGLVPKDDLRWPYDTFVQFDLASTGDHTVEIAGKGSGMRLDWVLIKHETVAANPQGMGLPHTP